MKRLLAAALAVFSLSTFLSPAVHAATTATTSTVFPSEIIGENFPDPDVFEQNGTWYASTTNGSRGTVPVATRAERRRPVDDPRRRDARRPVRRLGPTRPHVGAGRVSEPGRHLHPHLHRVAQGVRSAVHRRRHRDEPARPVQPVGTAPLICPLDIGGAIDANTFVGQRRHPVPGLEERRQRDRSGRRRSG